MTVASLEFLAFALLAAVAFNALPVRWWRDTVLLIANLAFLASFSRDLALWIPMATFLAAGYAGTRFLQSRSSANSISFVALIVLTVVAFAWLKQYTFLPSAILLKTPYVTIGLSYMFFRLAHLLIDAHGKNLPARITPLGYFNYIANFTSLVSGPIQRYEDFAADAQRIEPLKISVIGAAVERVIIGLFKVAVVSMLLLRVHEDGRDAFAAAHHLGAHIVAASVIGSAYVFYLYYNFAGYMDIVIGIARLFAINLPENFNKPFAANNFMEFWARWHMTLSNWLRVYVYNPLLMSLLARFPQPALGPMLAVAAIFVTFFLIGIWHGQTAVFVLYGVLLGLGVSANLLYQQQLAKRMGRQRYRALAGTFSYQMAARGLTFGWFTLSLFCFWAGWNEIATVARELGWLGIASAFLATILVATVAFALLEGLKRIGFSLQTWTRDLAQSRYVRTIFATALVWCAVAVLLLGQATPTIVYEKF